MKFRAVHVFRNISLPDYEKLYFDDDFHVALCRAVKLARKLEKFEERDGRIERAVRVGPDREIPAPVAKVLGAKRIEYTEHLTYVLGSLRGNWHTVSSLMTDKVDSHGTFAFREVPGGVERTVDGSIEVKLFGVGKLIEKFIVADVERSYDDAAAFTQKWIDSGGRP